VKFVWKTDLQKYEPESYLSQETPDTRFKPQMTYEYFLRFYKENFNYPFGRPRTDICTFYGKIKLEIQCEKIAAVRETLKREFQLHKCKAKSFYDGMRECQTLVKEGGAVHSTSDCVVFYYMQNIPYPYIPVTEIFYARQLWLYGLGFHRVSDDRAFMYPYSELNGKKIPNGTVSFLHRFLENHVSGTVKSYTFSPIPVLLKITTTFFFKYLYHLVMSGRFDYIRHVFPTKGHSYLPCDRDFALTDLRKRKQGTVYTAEQWVNIMKEGANNVRILVVEQSMIKNYKTLLSSLKDPVPLCRNQGKWKVTTY
jgi:hypothetical protein